MLVLSRKRLQQVVIGTEIRITVVKVEGSQVRLAIEAPPELTVLRAELLENSPAGARARRPACVRGAKERGGSRQPPPSGQMGGPAAPVC